MPRSVWGGVETAAHRLSLTQHPAGAYVVEIASKYGLACPDPASLLDDPDILLQGSNSAYRRHEKLILLCRQTGFRLIGVGFDGSSRTIPLSTSSSDLFGFQIQGVFSRRMR